MTAENEKGTGAQPPVSIPSQFFVLADEIARRFATPFSVGERELLFVPSTGSGREHQVLDLEQYKEAPSRIREAFNFLDLESFCAYVNRHNVPGQSVIFINTDPDKPQVTAVLDYHSEENEPSWCSHKVVYAFPNTKEWSEWKTSNKSQKQQTDMGIFIEDHMDQIASPPANVLFQTVMAMKETRTVTFGSTITLQNGMVEFQYVEEGANGGKGKFMLPEEIGLVIAPFKDGQTYSLKARMRYRCKEATLTLWYELVRPDLVIEQAIKDVRKKVEDETNLPVFAAQRT